jgi:ornithine decarboxylase
MGHSLHWRDPFFSGAFVQQLVGFLCTMRNHIGTIASVQHKAEVNPLFVFRPHALKRAADFFVTKFQGTPLFAVKTNPEKHALEALHANGVTSFDVASLDEIITIRSLFPEAELFYMHPVKSRHSIREAYFTHGIRRFSLDCMEELNKIREETEYAQDLCLFLRLSIPNTHAELTLADKFGCSLPEAPILLRAMSQFCEQLGISFHVGSQCMHPDAYRIAIRLAGEVIEQSGMDIDYFNVGGGFPSIYPGMTPPPMEDFFDAIHDEFAKVNTGRDMKLLCEPGRALVAEATSVIVRVDLRKGTMLYINDGTYGSLFDAGTPKFIFPVQLLRSDEMAASEYLPFSFYGPTCDSLDCMKGPFYLPKDMKEGDYIEIGQLGAYGRTMATKFNGFGHEERVAYVSDEPLMTMYGEDSATRQKPYEVRKVRAA